MSQWHIWKERIITYIREADNDIRALNEISFDSTSQDKQLEFEDKRFSFLMIFTVGVIWVISFCFKQSLFLLSSNQDKLLPIAILLLLMVTFAAYLFIKSIFYIFREGKILSNLGTTLQNINDYKTQLQFFRNIISTSIFYIFFSIFIFLLVLFSNIYLTSLIFYLITFFLTCFILNINPLKFYPLYLHIIIFCFSCKQNLPLYIFWSLAIATSLYFIRVKNFRPLRRNFIVFLNIFSKVATEVSTVLMPCFAAAIMLCVIMTYTNASKNLQITIKNPNSVSINNEIEYIALSIDSNFPITVQSATINNTKLQKSSIILLNEPDTKNSKSTIQDLVQIILSNKGNYQYYIIPKNLNKGINELVITYTIETLFGNSIRSYKYRFFSISDQS